MNKLISVSYDTVLVFSSCIRNAVPLKVLEGVRIMWNIEDMMGLIQRQYR